MTHGVVAVRLEQVALWKNFLLCLTIICYLSYVAHLLQHSEYWRTGCHFPDFPGAQQVHTQTVGGKAWWERSRTAEKGDRKALDVIAQAKHRGWFAEV